MKNAILSILILFFPIWTYAQENVWTLEECIGHALDRNISINQKKLSNELSEITLDQSKADLLPNLSEAASIPTAPTN